MIIRRRTLSPTRIAFKKCGLENRSVSEWWDIEYASLVHEFGLRRKLKTGITKKWQHPDQLSSSKILRKNFKVTPIDEQAKFARMTPIPSQSFVEFLR